MEIHSQPCHIMSSCHCLSDCPPQNSLNKFATQWPIPFHAQLNAPASFPSLLPHAKGRRATWMHGPWTTRSDLCSSTVASQGRSSGSLGPIDGTNARGCIPGRYEKLWDTVLPLLKLAFPVWDKMGESTSCQGSSLVHCWWMALGTKPCTPKQSKYLNYSRKICSWCSCSALVMLLLCSCCSQWFVCCHVFLLSTGLAVSSD